jgi:hypothetical protein
MPSKFIEQVEKCFNELHATEDAFVLLVRGHLYCESSLAELLRLNFKHPTEVKIDRLDYQAKVNLCSAMGVFDPLTLGPGLSKLGVIRNKYVHQLDYVASEQDQTDFINTLKATLGNPAQFYFRREVDYPNGLCRCVLALWLPLEILCAPVEERAEVAEAVGKLGAKLIGVSVEEFEAEVSRETSGYRRE